MNCAINSAHAAAVRSPAREFPLQRSSPAPPVLIVQGDTGRFDPWASPLRDDAVDLEGSTDTDHRIGERGVQERRHPL